MSKWTEYTQKEALKDNDELMILDTDGKANKRTLMYKVWDYVVDKMTSAVIAKLDTKDKTILGAINELNSKSFVTIAGGIDEIKKYLIDYKPKTITIISSSNNGFAIATPYNDYNRGYCGFLYYYYFMSSPTDVKCFSYLNGEWKN